MMLLRLVWPSASLVVLALAILWIAMLALIFWSMRRNGDGQ